MTPHGGNAALWHVAPGVAALREMNEPQGGAVPQPHGEVVLRALASGISRGTERLVHLGRVPASQHAAMRCPLQEGEFPFPVKYGYAAVGEDAAGQRHFCLHPHQARFAAPAHFCTPVPDDVPTHRAVLAANMETALNILWDAAPLPGERALVIGAGVVGLLAAFLLARIPGMAVTICDLDATRGPLARAMGAAFALPAAAPREQELILHASASEAGLRLALDCAANEARIIEASWFGDSEPRLPLGGAFHSRRLRLVSSQVGQVSPVMRGRRTHGERMALALSLLADARLDALLGPVIPFAELPARFGALVAGPGLCPVVTYPGE